MDGAVSARTRASDTEGTNSIMPSSAEVGSTLEPHTKHTSSAPLKMQVEAWFGRGHQGCPGCWLLATR